MKKNTKLILLNLLCTAIAHSLFAPAEIPKETISSQEHRREHKKRLLAIIEETEIPNVNSIIQYLSTINGDIGNVVDNIFLGKENILFWAIHKGENLLVKVLIEAGASLNRPDTAGNFPLTHAIISENLPAIDLLLAHGADVKLKTFNPITGKTYSALQLAMNAKKPTCFSRLIDAGADIEDKDDAESTLLMHAANSKNFDLTKKLIERGACLECKNKFGKTALDYAKKHTDDPRIAAIIQQAIDRTKRTTVETPA